MSRPVQQWYRGPWPRISRQVIARDGGICRMGLPGCTTRATTAQHRVSPRDGGAWFDLTNLIAACRHCNSVDGIHRRNGTRPHRPSREW